MSQSLTPHALIDILGRVPPTSPFFARASQVLDKVLAPSNGHVRPAPRGSRLLTVAMATYDDFDGTYFTVQAIRVSHPEVADEIDFLVLDNHPEGADAEPLRKLTDWIPDLRYLPYTRARGTAVRDVLFREAASEFVLCVDSHVLIAPGALSRLIAYLKAHRDTRDLLQGPLLYDDLRGLSTHFAPHWRGGMYGTWETDPRGSDPGGEPFEIPMHGLGLFACRREAWPGLNPRLRGFGGEEGYVHEKVRRAGGRILCLPFLRWVHRFSRPRGVAYRNAWEDRIRNYGIIHHELGWDPAPMFEHFREVAGEGPTETAASNLAQELAGPFHYFDAIYCVNAAREAERWRDAVRQFERLGIGSRIRRFDAIETPADPRISRALSHRVIIDEADRHGFQNVLVLHDDAVLGDSVVDELGHRISDLPEEAWWTLVLGGDRVMTAGDGRPVCALLRDPSAHPKGAKAIAYNRPSFAPLLAELPATPSLMALWLRRGRGTAGTVGEEPPVAAREMAVPVETRRA